MLPLNTPSSVPATYTLFFLPSFIPTCSDTTLYLFLSSSLPPLPILIILPPTSTSSYHPPSSPLPLLIILPPHLYLVYHPPSHLYLFLSSSSHLYLFLSSSSPTCSDNTLYLFLLSSPHMLRYYPLPLLIILPPHLYLFLSSFIPISISSYHPPCPHCSDTALFLSSFLPTSTSSYRPPCPHCSDTTLYLHHPLPLPPHRCQPWPLQPPRLPSSPPHLAAIVRENTCEHSGQGNVYSEISDKGHSEKG